MPDHSSIKVLSTITPQIDEAIKSLVEQVTRTATDMPEGRDIGFNSRKALAVIRMRVEELQNQDA